MQYLKLNCPEPLGARLKNLALIFFVLVSARAITCQYLPSKLASPLTKTSILHAR